MDRLRASGTQGQDPVTGGLTGTHGSGLGGAPFGLDYSGIASNDMGSLGFLFGKVGGSMLEVQLNLMEKDGNINILSSPSITTLDNKMAYTENGEKVPYVSTSNMGDREVKFEDAVLAPRDDAQRHRRRQPQAQSAGQEGRSGHLPFRGRQSLHHQEADRNDPHHAQRRNRGHLRPDQGKGDGHQRGVPGLKDIPGGKYVFGHESKGKTMEEVLIFITPEILPTRELPPLPSAPSMSESPSLRNGALPAPSAGAARR